MKSLRTRTAAINSAISVRALILEIPDSTIFTPMARYTRRSRIFPRVILRTRAHFRAHLSLPNITKTSYLCDYRASSRLREESCHGRQFLLFCFVCIFQLFSRERRDKNNTK